MRRCEAVVSLARLDPDTLWKVGLRFQDSSIVVVGGFPVREVIVARGIPRKQRLDARVATLEDVAMKSLLSGLPKFDPSGAASLPFAPPFR